LSAGATCHAVQIKHAPGDDFAALDLGNGHKLAADSDLDHAAEDGGIPPAQQDGLASLEPCRICRGHGQRRDVVQRGLDRQERSFSTGTFLVRRRLF
jgi:hypothetical protein